MEFPRRIFWEYIESKSDIFKIERNCLYLINIERRSDCSYFTSVDITGELTTIGESEIHLENLQMEEENLLLDFRKYLENELKKGG